jgi:outer membrane protein assembly factor BamB
MHTVHALSADTGKKLWSFTVGGRVDSPPTLYGGRAYFGSTDGYLYCLNASDGSLVWRFLAAADDKRLIAYDQVESVHPVNGSVLIQDGIIYCLAGRSMFLDGGLRLYRLDADTGKELSVNVMNEIDPLTGKFLQEKTVKQSMPPSMPDILSCDGKRVYMGAQPFDLNGKRTEVETHNEDLDPETIFALQQEEGRHIFSHEGFLDDSRFHRARWIYGNVFFGGHQDEWRSDWVAPVGNLLVDDENNVYGYHGNIAAGDNSLKDRLFSVCKYGTPEKSSSSGKQKLKYNWIIKSPYIDSMLIAGKSLFVTSVTEDEEKSFLQVYSAADGKKLAEYELPDMAVWNGMAAANNHLYMSLANGMVVCKEAN